MSKHHDSLLFMVLFREALDRLCVRLNMYFIIIIIFCLAVFVRVWKEWMIENNTFVAMTMTDGDSCGSSYRSTKVGKYGFSVNFC